MVEIKIISTGAMRGKSILSHRAGRANRERNQKRKITIISICVLI